MEVMLLNEIEREEGFVVRTTNYILIEFAFDLKAIASSAVLFPMSTTQKCVRAYVCKCGKMKTVYILFEICRFL